MCEIVHEKEGTEVLSVYERDFYAGFPVVTRSSYGEGQAYYLAAESDLSFLRRFYENIFDSCGMKNVLGAKLPYGVTVTERTACLPDPADADKVLIEIDPGISFGTGKHETTQLCIRQLIKYMKQGDEVLDLGCGSGILSVVSLKLGAGHVAGTDVDEDCITSTYENFAVNHLEKAQGDFYVGNLIDDVALQEKLGTEKYDIVVANILADVIIPMAPVIPTCLKEGGIFITSGIIDFKEEEVAAAIRKAGLTVLEINHQGEWVGITARK